MLDSGVVTAILTVSVAFISAGAALLGQGLTIRASRLQADLAMQLTIRQEQKEAIADFLRTTQRVELLIDEWKVAPHTEEYRGVPLVTSPGDASAAVHAMWLEVRKLELLCSTEVHQAAVRYTEKANEYVWNDVPGEMRHKDYLEPWRRPFLDAAKHELGLDGAAVS
jgi:hypothetical protein